MNTTESVGKLRVYLVDDHPVVREGFARTVADEPDMIVVGQAGSAEQTMAEAPSTKPDLMLVDLNIPDQDGIELLVALRTRLPRTKLVVLSGYDDEFRVAEALRAGALGYLVKSAPLEELVDGIRKVARGEAALSADVAGAVVRAMRRPADAGAQGIELLTPRERQVLRLLAAGISTRETAKRLTISPKTVETHRVRIYQKLGCKSAVELTRIAVRTGLIEA